MPMKVISTLAALFTLLAFTPAVAKSHGGSNPLGAVLSLIDQLSAKIVKQGEEEQKAYEEYVEWCDDASKNTAFEIKTLKSKKEGLEALIDKMTANIIAATDTIGKLVASISEAESELKDASAIRDKEKAEFLVAEGELVDGIDALDRAIAILEREMAKNPAFLQKVDTSDVEKMVKSLSAVLDAAAFSVPDQKKTSRIRPVSGKVCAGGRGEGGRGRGRTRRRGGSSCCRGVPESQQLHRGRPRGHEGES